MDEVNKIKASQHDSYGMYTLISFLLPLIGIIVGIVFLTKDKKLDKKLGEHCIAFGILSIILWSVVFAVLVGFSSITSPITTTDTTGSASDLLSNQPLEDVIKIEHTSVKNDGYGIYEVVGEATNNDTESRTISLKATFYDSSGAILGTASGAVDSLAPSKTKTFNLVSTDKISGYAKYKVQVDSIF